MDPKFAALVDTLAPELDRLVAKAPFTNDALGTPYNDFKMH